METKGNRAWVIAIGAMLSGSIWGMDATAQEPSAGRSNRVQAGGNKDSKRMAGLSQTSREEASGEKAVQHVEHLGPSGYYFLSLPALPVADMRVTHANGGAGVIEPTLRGDRLRVRLEKGMNRVEVMLRNEAGASRGRKVGRTRSPKTLRYYIFWNGS